MKNSYFWRTFCRMIHNKGTEMFLRWNVLSRYDLFLTGDRNPTVRHCQEVWLQHRRATSAQPEQDVNISIFRLVRLWLIDCIDLKPSGQFWGPQTLILLWLKVTESVRSWVMSQCWVSASPPVCFNTSVLLYNLCFYLSTSFLCHFSWLRFLIHLDSEKNWSFISVCL